MGDDGGGSPPPQPTPMPAPPTPTQLAQQAYEAQAQTAPSYLSLNQQMLPGYAQLFTDIQKQQAPQMAQLNLGLQQQYTPGLIDVALNAVKQADPTGFAIREQLGKQVSGDLAAGGALTPEETMRAQQDIRAGQVQRGVGTGWGDVISEASQLNLDQFAREQARQAAARAFMQGRSPLDEFGAVNIAGRTVPMESPNVSGFALQPAQTGQLLSTGMQSANMLRQNIESQNEAAMQQWQYQQQQANQPNPFLEGLIGAGTLAATAFGGPAGAAGAQMFGSALGVNPPSYGGGGGGMSYAGGGGGFDFGTSNLFGTSTSPGQFGSGGFGTTGLSYI